jgi:hypothetical protein
MSEHADYAEILRLYRKYSARPDEPLWVTFVMLGQRLERIEARAPDPRGPFFSTQWEREDYERRQRGEPELGPGVSDMTKDRKSKGD